MQALQGLVLYKRHNVGCPVHRSKIPLPKRRFWMGCSCQIWIVGRLPSGESVPRQPTGCTEIKRAEAVRAAYLAHHAKGAKDDAIAGPTIRDCAERYLASRRHDLGEKTLRQHELMLERLVAFCESRDTRHARDLGVDLLETFKTEGLPEGLAGTSRATAVAKLRCFLKEAFRREWIKEPLVERVRGHAAVYEQKDPYTDDQIKAIFAESQHMDGTTGYAGKPKTFTVLLQLMLDTGMRVGDAVRFDPKVCVRGDHLWIYTFFPQKRKKTQRPKPVEAFLTDGLKKAIDSCVWMSHALPFAYGSSANTAYLGNQVYERMSSIGRRCGVEDCRPHRLRDTFAVRKLLSGMSIEDLSRLLGHSSVKVTEQYYAKWVRARKTRLEKMVAETLTTW